MIDAKMAPYGALLLRMSMGILFLFHGVYLKAIAFGMTGTGKFFLSLGAAGMVRLGGHAVRNDRRTGADLRDLRTVGRALSGNSPARRVPSNCWERLALFQ